MNPIHSHAVFFQQVKRDATILLRQPKMVINSVLFFAMIIVFFPLSLVADAHLLQQVASGLLWIAVLLAFLLASERLFQQEYDEGVLEQWLISPISLPAIVSAKLLVYWFFTILPMVIVGPLLCLLFNFSGFQILIALLSLVIGSPGLFTLCALAAAFGIGNQNKAIFMGLILLPLAIPLMIIGSMGIHAALTNLTVSGYLALQAAFSLLCVSALPFAISTVLRISLCE